MTDLRELQDLMKMYRESTGYVSGASGGESVEPVFLLAVVRSVADYVEKIEGDIENIPMMDEKAYKIATSLLMCALDISNLFDIDLSSQVMESFLEKFTTKEI